MAYDDFLADRMRLVLKEKNVNYEEKAMMGGLTFMVDDKMCVGIIGDNLMAQIWMRTLDPGSNWPLILIPRPDLARKKINDPFWSRI